MNLFDLLDYDLPRGGYFGFCQGDGANLANKAVTVLGDGLDVLRSPNINFQRFPQSPDDHLEVPLLDKGIRPNGLDQVLFLKEVSTFLDHEQKRIEGFRAHRNSFPIAR